MKNLLFFVIFLALAYVSLGKNLERFEPPLPPEGDPDMPDLPNFPPHEENPDMPDIPTDLTMPTTTPNIITSPTTATTTTSTTATTTTITTTTTTTTTTTITTTTTRTTARRTTTRRKCRGGNSCCTYYNKCGSGEGDCDRNSDCKGSLYCGTNNCAWKWSSFDSWTDDCCTRIKPASCFLGNTQILMKNGKTKAISELKTGEVILDGNLKAVKVES